MHKKILLKGGKMKIDVEKIPQKEVWAMARATLEGAREFYKNPENVRAFNEWLEKRKKSQEYQHN